MTRDGLFTYLSHKSAVAGDELLIVLFSIIVTAGYNLWDDSGLVEKEEERQG